MSQVAKRYGVTTGAIWRWLKNHKLLGQTERRGKYRYITPTLLKRYLRETARDNVTRAAEKPEGYIGLYEAQEMLGTNITVIYRAVARGDVGAVRVGHTQYYREGDIRVLKESVENTPPEGWEMVRARAESLGADPSTAVRWLTRNGFQTAKHRAPDLQLAVYTPASSLDAWQAHYAALPVRRAA
jgi:hypothetical protein